VIGARALVLGAALAALSASCAPARLDQATIRFHYSHFEPSVVTVPAGVPLTVTLRNDDPIDHEWIIGSAEVHEVHRHGTEAVHGHLPTEITVPALSTRVTTITLDEPGQLSYICHLPGHEQYGMIGTMVAR
jgi:uncharacterized cupredoxin-like copper-binding protein